MKEKIKSLKILQETFEYLAENHQEAEEPPKNSTDDSTNILSETEQDFNEYALSWLKTKGVVVNTREEYARLMQLIEQKTDWIWGGSKDKPTKLVKSSFSDIIELYCDKHSGMMFDSCLPSSKLISLDKACSVLEILPDKAV